MRDTQYHGWSHPFIFHFVERIPSSYILCSTYSLLQGLIGNKEIFLITFSHLLLFPQISKVVNDNKSLTLLIIETKVFKRCLHSWFITIFGWQCQIRNFKTFEILPISFHLFRIKLWNFSCNCKTIQYQIGYIKIIRWIGDRVCRILIDTV